MLLTYLIGKREFYIVTFEDVCNLFQHKNHIGLILKFLHIEHLGSQLLVFLKLGSMWQILHVNHDFFPIIINYYKWNRGTKSFLILYFHPFQCYYVVFKCMAHEKIKTFISFIYFTMLAPPLYMITIHTNGVIILFFGHHY